MILERANAKAKEIVYCDYVESDIIRQASYYNLPLKLNKKGHIINRSMIEELLIERLTEKFAK